MLSSTQLTSGIVCPNAVKRSRRTNASSSSDRRSETSPFSVNHSLQKMPEPLRRKSIRFHGRGNIGAFVGFSEEAKAYKVYLPEAGRPIKITTDIIPLSTMLFEDIILPDDAVTAPREHGGGNTSPADDEDDDDMNPPRVAASRRIDPKRGRRGSPAGHELEGQPSRRVQRRE
jgi:hypothetical protein